MRKQPALSACTWVLGSGQAGFSGTLHGRSLSWLLHHLCTGGQCPGAVLWGGLGVGRCARAVPRSRRDQDSNASPQLSRLQLSATAWLIPAQTRMGDADALQWHLHGFAKPSEALGVLMPPRFLGTHMLLPGHMGFGLAGCAGEPGSLQMLSCPWHTLLCTGSCVPAQSYPLCAMSTRLLPGVLQFRTWIPLPTALSILII